MYVRFFCTCPCWMTANQFVPVVATTKPLAEKHLLTQPGCRDQGRLLGMCVLDQGGDG